MGLIFKCQAILRTYHRALRRMRDIAFRGSYCQQDIDGTWHSVRTQSDLSLPFNRAPGLDRIFGADLPLVP